MLKTQGPLNNLTSCCLPIPHFYWPEIPAINFIPLDYTTSILAGHCLYKATEARLDFSRSCVIWPLMSSCQVPAHSLVSALPCSEHSQTSLLHDLNHHGPAHLKSLHRLPSSSPAAKSLQLCLSLCDPIYGSPPGSSIPRICQARILERVAISFPPLPV